MVTYSRVEVNGKKFEDFKTASITKATGDSNYTSNFTLAYENWGGIYKNAWNIGDEVVVSIGSQYPLGDGLILRFDANDSVNNVGNDFDLTDGLVFHTDLDNNTLDNAVPERTTPYPQPIAWYPLDGDANDISGFERHGTVVAGGFSSARGKTAFVVGSGISDYIALPNTVLSGLGNFTLNFWTQIDVNDNNYFISSVRTDNVNEFLLGVLPTGSLFGTTLGSATGGGYTPFSSGTSLKLYDNEWHNISLVRSGTTVSNAMLYIDGALIDTVACGSGIINAPSGNTVMLGQEADIFPISGLQTSQNLFGKLQDFKIYDRALDSTDIYDIYESGRKVGDFKSNELAWYKLDGNLWDSSTYGFTGRLGSAITYDSAGKIGSCLHFSAAGGSAFVDIGNNNILMTTLAGTGPKSVAAWINPADISAGYAWALAIGSGVATQSIGLGRKTGSIVYLGYGADYLYNANLQSGIWVHAVAVYSGTQTFGYYNGSLIGSTTTNFNTGSTVAYLGQQTSLTQYWNGKIDDVRIYPYAISSSDVAFIYNSGSGTDLPLSNYDNGKIGNAGKFNGYKCSVNYPLDDKYNFDVSQSFSYSCFIKISSQSSTSKMIMNTIPNLNPYTGTSLHLRDLNTNFPKFTVQIITDLTQRIEATYQANINDNNWHHICFTYNGNSKLSGIKVYVDGRLISINTAYYDNIGTTIKSQRAQLSIGHRTFSNTGDFDGNIDDVRIYNKELTPDEVTSLFNKLNTGGYFYGK